jgi:phosphopantothenoylcysteine decarboxylase
MSNKIVLGVTGSIAAHKAADLASLLTKGGCETWAVLTADAQRFITPLPFKTLTRNPVVTNLYDEEEGWKPDPYPARGRSRLAVNRSGYGQCDC